MKKMDVTLPLVRAAQGLRGRRIRPSLIVWLAAAIVVALEAAVACAQAPAAPSPASAPGRRRPNLVLLVTDDQRWDSLGCAGNPVLRTPHIDSLAAGGVRFTQSFSTCSICMASRASLITGLYTRSHGVDDFAKELPRQLLDSSYPSLLRRAGYRTGFVGKWGIGTTVPKDEFDYFAGFAGQGRYFSPGNPTHLTTIQARQAVQFIRGCNTEQPFCLSVSFKAPHVQDEGRNQPGIYAKYPYDRALGPKFQDVQIPLPRTRDLTPLPTLLDKTLNRTREAADFSPENYQETMKSIYRLIAGVDLAVGEIINALRDLGVEDDTVILFTSDQGSLYGEHGLGGKWLMLEESIRTPLIISDPRLPQALRGTTRAEMVLNIDVGPTLLALAGLEIPPHVQGRSVVPLVQGVQPAWRTEWFYEHTYRGTATSPVAASEGIRTNNWKYVRYIDEDPVVEQLFNLQVDPREERNLADTPEHRQTLEQLRQRWTAWRTDLANWRADVPWRDPAMADFP